MMPSLLRFREYVEAAKLARHRAESERHPHAKQILQEIERSYHRLVEFEKWAADQQQYNRPFAHFGLFNGHAGPTWFAMRDILSRSADQQIKNSADQQIKNRVPEKTTSAMARGRALSGYETANDRSH